MPLEKHKKNEDQTYGPAFVEEEKRNKKGEAKKHYYTSKQDHRRTAKPKPEKTRWIIEEGQEFSVFSEAIKYYWFCEENNCLFSLIDKGDEILGENDERIAKFPNDKNEDDPWHGYPVSPEKPQDRPSSKLLDIIEKNIDLPAKVRIKIEKGTL